MSYRGKGGGIEREVSALGHMGSKGRTYCGFVVICQGCQGAHVSMIWLTASYDCLLERQPSTSGSISEGIAI